MALSGSVDFAVTRDDLIQQALQYIGALEEGATPDSTQLSESATLLNILIKHWEADDIHLWVREFGYIFPISDISKTSLGAEGGHAAASYVYTTTSAASISGASTLTVTSITDMLNGDNIGFQLDTGKMQWTTINGTPSGSTVTLTATTISAVDSGAAVYVYTTKIGRPVTILDLWRRLSSDVTDTPMVRLSEQEYNDLPSKEIESTPIQWYHDTTLGFGASGYPGNSDLYFWPRFENGLFVLMYRYTKPFDDLDAASNNVEFPQMWFLPLMLGLAWLLAGKHGIPIKERTLLFQEMTVAKLAALGFDQEKGSLFIQPETRYN